MVWRANFSCFNRSIAAALLAVWCMAGVAAGAEVDASTPKESSTQAAWRKKLDDWYVALKRGEVTDLPQLADIDDPAAVQPVIAMLNREKSQTIKRRCLEALGNIGRSKALDPNSPAARELLAALVKASVEPNPIEGPDPIRAEAIKQIAQLPNKREAIPLYTKYLSTRHVSRAAEALLATKALPPLLKYEKPDPKLTPALIKALVQKEKRPVTEWVEWGWIGPNTFGGAGRKRLWGTGRITRLVEVDVPNDVVAKVLVEYTGQSYEYDRSAWHRWYTTRMTEVKK
jgi:hypothetical protein